MKNIIGWVALGAFLGLVFIFALPVIGHYFSIWSNYWK